MNFIFSLLIVLQTLNGANLMADRIMRLVQERDKARAERLAQYEVTRDYRVVNERWNKSGEMQVKLTFRSPDEKTFEVISEKGSEFIRSGVIERLMKTEQEGMRRGSRQENAFDSRNYTFSLLGEDTVRGRTCYVLSATPKREDTLLLMGRIYVDKEDLAVARIEGSPAKSPSFWITEVKFVRDYQKVGDFWLPAGDSSVTNVRIFGTTVMTVRFGPYTVVPRQENS